MRDDLQTFADLVRSNLRAFRDKAGLSHVQTASALSKLIGGKSGHTQSQSNERANALPYSRLAALAEIFDTEPWQFFVTNPPGLEATQGEEIPEFHSPQPDPLDILAPEEGEGTDTEGTDTEESEGFEECEALLSQAEPGARRGV